MTHSNQNNMSTTDVAIITDPRFDVSLLILVERFPVCNLWAEAESLVHNGTLFPSMKAALETETETETR